MSSTPWQPIETAPMDETPIIVGFDAASVWVVHVAWWRDGAALQAQGLDFTPADTGWWSYVRGSVTQEKLDGFRTPTHWIELPDVPGYSDEPVPAELINDPRLANFLKQTGKLK